MSAELLQLIHEHLLENLLSSISLLFIFLHLSRDCSGYLMSYMFYQYSLTYF